MTENTEKKKWEVVAYVNQIELEDGLNRASKEDMEPLYIIPLLPGFVVVYVNYM